MSKDGSSARGYLLLVQSRSTVMGSLGEEARHIFQGVEVEAIIGERVMSSHLLARLQILRPVSSLTLVRSTISSIRSLKAGWT